MEEKRIYRLSLLLPIVIPVICIPISMATNGVIPDWMSRILFLTIYSVFVGGIPYLAVAVLLLVWMWHMEIPSIRVGLFLSPLLMTLVFFVCGFALHFVASESPLSSLTFDKIAESLIGFTAYILIYGYFYVSLTFALARIFRK